MANDTGVRIESLPCPNCGETKVYEVSQQSLKMYKNNYHIQEAFPQLPSEDRERFISGYCGSCWDILFADDEE